MIAKLSDYNKVMFNGTEMSKVVFNGVEVWSTAKEDDDTVVAALVQTYGVKNALKQFILAKRTPSDTLTSLCERFFTSAAKLDTVEYGSEFYADGTGAKLDGNNYNCTPSTNTLAGEDEYAARPLFACWDVNYKIDSTSLEPVIVAIEDVVIDDEYLLSNFSRTTPMDNSLVGVMQMTGWVYREAAGEIRTVKYRATHAEGFRPLPEAVRAADNTVRPFVIHAKYAAGYYSEGLLSSVSGVQPATYRIGSTGSTAISFNGQSAKWRELGGQYCGSSLCDVAFVQIMLELKYATLGSAQVMAGCNSYYTSYTAAVAEAGVSRVLLAAEQGAYFVAGSCVSLGSTNDRAKATTYDVCDITKIISIEDVTVDGTAYKAVNLDTETPFNVTTATYIVPQPWQTGSTDKVLGNDGSPHNNTNGKEPCKIQGIEVMVGTFEVLGDTTLYEDAEKYTVYLNRKAADIDANSNGTNPVMIGTVPKEPNASWKYISDLNWYANNQEAYMLIQAFGGSSITDYRAGIYCDGATTTGWREWLSFGDLNTGGHRGFACARLNSVLGGVYWNIAARACGTAGNRGIYEEE